MVSNAIIDVQPIMFKTGSYTELFTGPNTMNPETDVSMAPLPATASATLLTL